MEQGVLPRLIATLVSRRRQVKSLMKDKTATQQKLLQVRVVLVVSSLPCNLMPFPERVVGYQTNGAQAYREQYVWVPRFRVLEVLRAASGCPHDAQRS